jgi:hypothetical protein
MSAKPIVTALMLSALLGCVQAESTPPPAPMPPVPDYAVTECSDPRPQICTMDYTPVCAQRDTGIRCVTTPCPSSEWKTYSNGCSACSDSDVSGYRSGSCEDEPAP